MKLGLDRKINQCFEQNGSNITMDDIKVIVKEQKSNLSIEEVLFSFVHFSLDRFETWPHLDYIYQSMIWLKSLIEKGLYNKKIEKRLKKVLDKLKTVQRQSLEQSPINQGEEKQFEKLENLITETIQNYQGRQDSPYQLLEFLITEIKNIHHLEKLFSQFPKLVNCIDKEGNTIFYKIFQKEMEIIQYDKSNLTDISYYYKVLELIHKNKQFNLPCEQMKNCLKELQDSLKINKNTTLLQLKKLLLNQELGIDKRNSLSTYLINKNFDKILVDELKMYQTTISKENYPDRVILDDYIITIDGSNTVEIDDALSVKRLQNGNTLLGVHIATPLGYLPFESLNIQEAIKRGSTIYLPSNPNEEDINDLKEDFIPIFQESFSADLASLKEHVSRLAKSYFFEIDDNGYVVNQKYMKTIINNHRQCSYDEVNHIIEYGCDDIQLQKMIVLLNNLTYKLESHFQAKEIYLNKKSQKRNPAQIIVGNSRAEKIISTLMVLTGSNVADFFAHSKEGYPTLYRVHQVNEEDFLKVQQEIQNLSGSNINQKFNKAYHTILDFYPSATYDIKGSHQGLNLKHYCHCTSSLRRSADIIVEHALDICYFHHPTDQEIEHLETIILKSKDVINNRNTEIDLFLNDYNHQLRKTKKCQVHKK